MTARTEESRNDLPEGWAMASLANAAKINPRKPPADALGLDAPVTFVPMAAVDEVTGTIAEPQERPFGKVRKGYTGFAEGDVLFAKITPCMENGKAAIAHGLTNGLGFGSTEFHVLRPEDGVLSEFIYYYVRQESFRGQAQAAMSGTAGQLRVRKDFLEEAMIPLAPSAEQKRIVAKMAALLTRVRTARERLERVPATLKCFRQSVLAAACSGYLTQDWRDEHPNVESAIARRGRLAKQREALWSTTARTGRRYVPPQDVPDLPASDLPETWCWATVSHLCLQDVGFAFKSSEFSSQGVRLLRGENVEPGGLTWSNTRYWPEDRLEGFEHLLVGEGDVILAMDRPIISKGLKLARVRQSDTPCLLVQRVTRFLTLEQETSDYLYLRLMHQDFARFLAHDGMTGSDLPHITGTGVAAFPVPLPPIEEQREIVRRVEGLFKLADTVETHVAGAKRRAERLAQGILAKAFRGELVPTEAELARQEGREYEPASVLLKRIREPKEMGKRGGRSGSRGKPRHRKQK